ncbi:MAG: molecular chaperone TorD family protein [Myxococcota bacterium]|nr:molecular chaperone TorD family protein [Myxococcota bacterium]
MPAISPDIDSDLLLSVDRARVYRALAGLFRMPDGESLGEVRERNLPELCESLERLTEEGDGSTLVGEARALCELFEDTEVERLRRGHDLAFDESSAIRCAPTEMDQLDGTPQLELTRTFEMADVGGFYKAFGVELGDSEQRVDHIAAELEFMNLLAAKEFTALKEEGPGENAQICRDASRVFLRDHLVRWAPRFGECLSAADGDPIYSAAGRLLGGFIVFDALQIDADGAPVHNIDPAARKDLPQSL